MAIFNRGESRGSGGKNYVWRRAFFEGIIVVSVVVVDIGMGVGDL